MTGELAALRKVTREPRLRRVEVSFIAFAFAENATWLAILVYAYQRGGAREAGLIAAVQLLPAMAIAPFAAYAGDRFRPDRALAVGFLAQAAAMGATAAAMWAGAPLVAYAGAVATAMSTTFTRPVTSALLPAVTRSPADLIAANVMVGFLGNLGMFLGPMAAAGILAVSGPEAVLAAGAAACLVALLGTLRIGLEPEAPLDVGSVSWRDVLREMSAGLRLLTHHAPVRTLVLVVALGALTVGMVDVLAVVFAEERLRGGGSQAGLLSAAFGIGAIAGTAIAAGLISGSRAMRYLALGALLMGLPLVVLSWVQQFVLAAAFFAALGAGQSVLAVTGAVALQRKAPGHLLARIFGALEGVQMLMLAVGAVTISALVEVMGLRSAIVAAGVAVLALCAVGISVFVRRDGDAPPPPHHVIERLRRDPVLAHLDLAASERLAMRLQRLAVPPEHQLITEGDVGDCYYLLLSGSVAVSRNGDRLRRLDGECSFGEIALIHDIPRTSTVTTVEQCVAYAITRDDFLEAVTRQPRSLASAREIADEHQQRTEDP